MNEQNNNEMNSQQTQNVANAEAKPPKKRNGLFTLFACIMTAIIVVLAMNLGQQISKGMDKETTSNSNKAAENSNSNEEKKDEVSNSNDTSNPTTSNSNTNTNTNTVANTTIIFDSSKSINNRSEKNYTLSSQGPTGLYAMTDTTQKILKFSYTPSVVAEYYSLDWGSTRTTVKTDEITFNKKIVDLFFGGFGRSSAGDTLFILLEDGTVEYIPIVHMFNNVQGAAVSYGAIKDVSDVVKFTIADKNGSITTLAIKSDGSFYDLDVSLKNTGNY